MSTLPPAEVMYKALLERDSSFEGIFWVGVKTTGIFCRPTCAARKPREENVEFFAAPQEALYAGYRPCTRCRPLELIKSAPEPVQRLCEIVDKSPSGKITSRELRDMGIDPSTARRQFRKYFGMTFQAYHRARRMGVALKEIRAGETVIGAQIDQGFDSASGFFEAFKQVFGNAPSRADAVRCLYTRWLETPLGAMLAVAGDDGLYLLEFVDRRGLEKEISDLRHRTGMAIVPGNNPHLEQISRELKDYFDSKASLTLAVPLVIIGSPFEKEVWAALQTIPPGETRSYTELAQQVGKPKGMRAVGQANGRNRLALVIPCHRVIRADGNLCGYGGQVWRKKWLLEHEREMMTRNPATSAVKADIRQVNGTINAAR